MLSDLHMSRKFKSILEQCIAGERKAQRVLFQELRGKLMGICHRYSNNIDEEQDIFQEAMIKIFQNIERGTEMDNFLGWASRITINTAIDFYKKNRASLFVELDNAVDFYFSDDQITIFQSMENDEILQLLATLPENQRMVFNLYIIEGYTLFFLIMQQVSVWPGLTMPWKYFQQAKVYWQFLYDCSLQ